MSKRLLKGKVVSVKMKDTVVVAVTRLKLHPKYKKTIKLTKKYKAHYTGGNINYGDKVIIEESRPISRTKKWVIKAVEKGSKREVADGGLENG
jgi:small subunit ribosomal protein S17